MLVDTNGIDRSASLLRSHGIDPKDVEKVEVYHGFDRYYPRPGDRLVRKLEVSFVVGGAHVIVVSDNESVY